MREPAVPFVASQAGTGAIYLMTGQPIIVNGRVLFRPSTETVFDVSASLAQLAVSNGTPPTVVGNAIDPARRRLIPAGGPLRTTQLYEETVLNARLATPENFAAARSALLAAELAERILTRATTQAAILRSKAGEGVPIKAANLLVHNGRLLAKPPRQPLCDVTLSLMPILEELMSGNAPDVERRGGIPLLDAPYEVSFAAAAGLAAAPILQAGSLPVTREVLEGSALTTVVPFEMKSRDNSIPFEAVTNFKPSNAALAALVQHGAAAYLAAAYLAAEPRKFQAAPHSEFLAWELVVPDTQATHEALLEGISAAGGSWVDPTQLKTLQFAPGMNNALASCDDGLLLVRLTDPMEWNAAGSRLPVLRFGAMLQAKHRPIIDVRSLEKQVAELFPDPAPTADSPRTADSPTVADPNVELDQDPDIPVDIADQQQPDASPSDAGSRLGTTDGPRERRRRQIEPDAPLTPEVPGTDGPTTPVEHDDRHLGPLDEAKPSTNPRKDLGDKDVDPGGGMATGL